MNLLLDTHAVLWAVAAPENLPPPVSDALVDRRNGVFVSAVNTWEMAIKAGLGRLDAPFGELPRIFEDAGFEELPVTVSHTLLVKDLPNHHRDPFDRLLLAQAMAEELTLVTRDSQLHAYGVPVFWPAA